MVQMSYLYIPFPDSVWLDSIMYPVKTGETGFPDLLTSRSVEDHTYSIDGNCIRWTIIVNCFE